MLKNVFLTGATGFIGSHVLELLLINKEIKSIYLLYRTESLTDTNPIVSLKTKLNNFKINYDDNSLKKIHLIPGDICLPKLGMHENNYSHICKHVDIIYHLAAKVHHTLSFSQLEAANVASVIECLKIAETGNSKILNFTSTLGAATKKDSNNLFTEDFPDHTQLSSKMGYLQSKHRAEIELAQCSLKSRINIFRLGYISSHSKNGVCLYNDNQLILFIKSCIQLKVAPIINRHINFTPVDFAAKIMTCSNFLNIGGQVLNLGLNDHCFSWLDLTQWINHNYLSLDTKSFKEWQYILGKNIKSNALLKLYLLYRRKDAENKIIRFGRFVSDYQTNLYKTITKQHHICIPSIDNNYLSLMFHYLIEQGFLPSYSSYQGNL